MAKLRKTRDSAAKFKSRKFARAKKNALKSRALSELRSSQKSHNLKRDEAVPKTSKSSNFELEIGLKIELGSQFYATPDWHAILV